MTLEKYRKEKKLTYQKLADLIGINGVSTAGTVLRWCKGQRVPRSNWMKIIKKITNGQVTAASFYE